MVQGAHSTTEQQPLPAPLISPSPEPGLRSTYGVQKYPTLAFLLCRSILQPANLCIQDPVYWYWMSPFVLGRAFGYCAPGAYHRALHGLSVVVSDLGSICAQPRMCPTQSGSSRAQPE